MARMKFRASHFLVALGLIYVVHSYFLKENLDVSFFLLNFVR